MKSGSVFRRNQEHAKHHWKALPVLPTFSDFDRPWTCPVIISRALQDSLPLAIDFTGGSLLEVKFVSAQPQPADIIALYETLNVSDTQVQTTGEGSYVIRSSELAEEVAFYSR